MTSYESTTTRLLHREMNICNLVEDLLPLYIEGELSVGSRDMMVEHLAHCEHCAGFLAGAQSMRMLLRHDTVARSQTVVRDQPAQQTIRRWQQLFIRAATLVGSAVALAVSAAVWSGLHWPATTLGPLLALLAFAGVVTVAQRRGPLSLIQWVILCVGCAAGGIGAASVLVPFGDPVARFFGLLLVLGSLTGIRYIVGKELLRRS